MPGVTMSEHAHTVQSFILAHVAAHPRDIAKVTAAHFGVSRQAVNKHIRKLVEEGVLVAEGTTRNKTYLLSAANDKSFSYPIVSNLAEDRVWRQDIRPALTDVSPQALRICEYSFTEIMNNAIEHSEGTSITVQIKPLLLEISVIDDGVGIFRKLKRDLDLEDERQAILELAKGKLTTDPTRHSGEGIFFTSRACDGFVILSGTLCFSHVTESEDWLLDSRDSIEGTIVRLRINPQTTRSLQSVFDKFASEEHDYGFDRTVVPVILAQYGDENLVSRSQARRLLARFERFREVVLDFDEITTLGQAFADEVFRVFRNQHPEVHMMWVNANTQIEKMIRRALAAGSNDH
jgi:biotin operon repressor/anti-sigma regulatory factor (Ser/Thr protein kinase)